MANEAIKTRVTKLNLDHVGVVGASLCAFHCAACAFLPGLLALGASAFNSGEAERDSLCSQSQLPLLRSG